MKVDSDLCLAFTCLYSLCEFGYIIPPRRNGVGMAALPGLASGFERAGVATGGASWQVLWRGRSIQRFSLFCILYLCILYFVFCKAKGKSSSHAFYLKD